MSAKDSPNTLSVEAVEAILREPNDWQQLSNEEILQVLFTGSAIYGSNGDASKIETLSSFIPFESGRTNGAELQSLVDRLVLSIDSGNTGANALLPFTKVHFVEFK